MASNNNKIKVLFMILFTPKYYTSTKFDANALSRRAKKPQQTAKFLGKSEILKSF